MNYKLSTNLKNKYLNYCFIVLFSLLINFYLLPNALMSIVLGLLVIISCFNLQKNNLKTNITLFVFFNSYYLFNILSLIWSDNISDGLNSLQSSLILPVLSFILIFSRYNIADHIIFYLTIFVSGTFIFCFGFYYEVILGYSLGVPAYSHLINSNIVESIVFILKHDLYSIFETASWGFYGINEKPFFFRQHNYFTSILLIAVIASAWLLIILKSKIKYTLLIAITLFSYTILAYKSQVNKGILILLPLLYILFKILVNYKSNKYFGLKIIFSVITLFIALLYLNQNILNFITKNEQERNILYNCLNKLIVGENFLFGYGLGDVEPLINNCIKTFRTDTLFIGKQYNTHSGFLYYFLNGGLINIVLYILFYAYMITSAIAKNNILLFLISIVILGNNLFENFSNLVLGAFTTSIFLLLTFFYKNNKHKESKSYV